ncbi:MAG: hypothetical protein IPG32_15220 [Saprospirales bacterium]|nr:hypothetical protein [Saprospirales bacterium]
MDNHSGQLEALENAIDIYGGQGIVHANVAYAYKNAAQIQEMRLNYPKAISYFEKALEYDTVGRYTASVYSFLSGCYSWQEDYDKALLIYEKRPSGRPIPNARRHGGHARCGYPFEKGDSGLAEQYARQALADGESPKISTPAVSMPLLQGCCMPGIKPGKPVNTGTSR